MTLTQVETELRVLQVTSHKVSHGTNWTKDTEKISWSVNKLQQTCVARCADCKPCFRSNFPLISHSGITDWSHSFCLCHCCGYSRKCGEGATRGFHIAAIPVAGEMNTLHIMKQHKPVSRGLKKPWRAYLSGNWILRTTWRCRSYL